MAVIRDLDRSITAPAELGLQTRTPFREAAFHELEELTDGGTLRLDLAPTRRVDSAGLSALWLIHRRAAERMQRVVLCNAREELKYLLTLTGLSELFEQN